MPRLFALFLIAFCLPARADVAALQASLRAARPQAEAPVAALQQLDAALLRPGSLYPTLDSFPLAALQALYRHRGQCGAPWPALPADLLRFERALCDGETLPPGWFAAHTIHPLGGSYAWHYLQRHPDAASVLQPYLHLRERPAAFAGIGKLGDDNLAALLSGERWLLDDGALWWRDGASWRRYGAEQWRPLADEAGLALSPLADGDACPQPLGRICARPLPPSPRWWRALAGFSLLAAAGVLAYGWLQRRRLERERRFVLQMLTHELRTPIAGLGNVVEDFRSGFDHLPPDAQQGFGRLADGVLRLRQLADASRHYLAADGRLEAPQPLSLSEWLDSVAERHGATYCLDQDRKLNLPVYWLGLCLDNLLRNARQHGRPPVRILACWEKGWLRLAVSDGGALPRYRLSLLRRELGANAGMGLGLAIVRRVIKRLGGRLALEGPPTTFALELPCDDIAD
ncbi:histidine kinase [Chromobacterium sp. ATCC 53434]|uniref:ATP-binding protein n=1 Tax=Chromobacterium sp. (strain ATCC 53434 / SC 14030) TaxID=2059672 RepID=UPI000C787164|nr:DUF3404 domain-containing protein [Chromobacterium sp. ATCC 53434]AUH52108.1 histidine kinase [Chromobacterium sp. ATCC 53434]